MTYIAMLFHEVPESLKVHLFNDEDHDLGLIRACHGCFINTTDVETYSEEVCKFLTKLSEDHKTAIFDSSRGDYKSTFTVPACEVVVCGFVL